MPAAIPITYQGQVFKAKSHLAEHLGISLLTLEKRIQNGVPENEWGASRPIRTQKLVRPSAQITYQGRIFESRVTLAAHLGIPVGRLKARIKAGWAEERWGEGSKTKPSFLNYEGHTYRAIELARHLGIDRTVLEFRVRQGWPQERWGEAPDFRNHSRLVVISYKGASYKGVPELAEHLGMAAATLRQRIDNGWPEEDWTKPSRNKWAGGIEYQSKRYKNPSQLAQKLGKDPRRLYKFLNDNGGDVDAAVDLLLQNNILKPITYAGVTYPSRTALANHFGVSLQTLVGRINAGLPEEEWITETMRVKAGYTFEELPEEAQQMAISLAASLGVEPAEAWAQIVERLV